MLVDHLSFIVAVALGFTFLASGLSKLRDPEGFVLGVLEYEVLPPRVAVVYGQMVPFIEAILGLALVLGVWSGLVGLVSLVLLGSFLVAVAINIARGRQLDCHCFGSRGGEPLGWITVIRLCILLTWATVVANWRGQAFLSAIPPEPVPAFLLGIGLSVSLYLLGTIPALWHIWHTKAVLGVTVNGGRVNLRDHPSGRCLSAAPSDESYTVINKETAT